MILSNVEITEDANFDPNNNYEYTVVNCILQEDQVFLKLMAMILLYIY
jgi:hypothetical protein